MSAKSTPSSDESASSSPVVLPESFVDQIQDILDHLHDFAYLLAHPFARSLQHPIGTTNERAAESNGQQLRREVLQAIESLSPSPSVSFRAPHARLYNILHLHYVEGMTVQEAAYELNISLRQAYRDLRRGEEGVAAVLWTRLAAELAPEISRRQSQSETSLQDEVRRIDGKVALVDIRQLLQRAEQAVDRLANTRCVKIDFPPPTEPVMVVTDEDVAQQVLVSELSHAIQDSQAGSLSLCLAGQQSSATLVFSYQSQRKVASAYADPVISQFANRLGWSITATTNIDALRTVTLSIPFGGRTILVIDDNEGLIELFERYLAGLPCRVVQASSARDGLAICDSTRPDAVVLDVMMPEIDGWQVLQTLQTMPSTNSIPVVICSVISDPQLAASLGAAYYLRKPFGRQDLRAALQQLNVI